MEKTYHFPAAGEQRNALARFAQSWVVAATQIG